MVRGVRDDEGGDPRKSSSTIRILSFPDQHVVRGVRDEEYMGEKDKFVKLF